MKKYIFLFLVLSLLLGGTFCKKNNNKNNPEDLAFWYWVFDFLNQGYLEVRYEDNLSQTKTKTLKSYDSDNYPEKFLTPYKIELCLPNIVSWEEGEEPTLQNAEPILGKATEESIQLCTSFGNPIDDTIEISKDKPISIKRFLFPNTNKKRDKLGLAGWFFIRYYFKDENLVDKNLRVIELNVSHVRSTKEEWEWYQGFIGKPLPPHYDYSWMYTELEYFPIIRSETYEYYNMRAYKMGNNILDVSHLYSNADYGCPSNPLFYILYDPAIPTEIFPYRYFHSDCEENQTIENHNCWMWYNVGSYGENPNLDNFLNQNPQWGGKYKLKYTEYCNIQDYHNESERLYPDFSYFKEDWEDLNENPPSSYREPVLFIAKQKLQQENLGSKKLVITIDVSNTFMWETEHPEWDYFDRVNDRPNPSIGKDFKIFFPRIKITAE